MSTTLAPRETLYDIDATLAQLNQERIAAEYEGDSEAIKAIDQQIFSYLEKKDTKIDSYTGLCRMKEAQAAELDVIGNRAHEAAKRLRADVERLKSNAIRVMQAFDVTMLESTKSRMMMRKCPVSLRVTDPAAVPIQYKNVTVTTSASMWRRIEEITRVYGLVGITVDHHVNNAALKTALQKGQTIPGAELVTDKLTLVVS